MSLIQDALKRQQEESEGNRVPLKAAAAPSVPDAMPVPPRPPAIRQPTDSIAGPQSLRDSVTGGRAGPDPGKPVQPGKSWKLIAGIIFVCILIAWGGSLLVVFVMKQSAERTLLGSFMPDMAHGRVTLGKPAIKTAPPPAYPPAAARSKPVVTPVRSSAPMPWLSPAAAAVPAFAAEEEDDENVVAPIVTEQELPAPAPAPVPVVWPRLKLSAIFSNVGSGQAGARLNNRLILLGDQIEGVTLIEIRRDGVVLKCGAEVRFLKMGMILN